MSKKQYSIGQIKELLMNINVKDCSTKYITFTDEFKIKALELDRKWHYHRTIFKDFWFPEYICSSEVPKDSLGNWRFKLKNKWLSWLIKTKKWRKNKENINSADISRMTLIEQNEFLKAENAFLKEIGKLFEKWAYP